MDDKIKNNLMVEHSSIILVIGVITGFIFIISFSVFYTTENFSSVCGCKLPLWVILVSIASLGVFVGTFTYYILTRSHLKNNKNFKKPVFKTLDFLEDDEKKIMKLLIENNGKIYQSKIKELLGFDKVKISRIVNSIEKKGLISKKKTGMTNFIELDKNLVELFCMV